MASNSPHARWVRQRDSVRKLQSESFTREQVRSNSAGRPKQGRRRTVRVCGHNNDQSEVWKEVNLDASMWDGADNSRRDRQLGDDSAAVPYRLCSSRYIDGCSLLGQPIDTALVHEVADTQRLGGGGPRDGALPPHRWSDNQQRVRRREAILTATVRQKGAWDGNRPGCPGPAAAS